MPSPLASFTMTTVHPDLNVIVNRNGHEVISEMSMKPGTYPIKAP